MKRPGIRFTAEDVRAARRLADWKKGTEWEQEGEDVYRYVLENFEWWEANYERTFGKKKLQDGDKIFGLTVKVDDTMPEDIVKIGPDANGDFFYITDVGKGAAGGT